MSRSKELVKNTAILTIGKMCTQFVSFLLLPLYTALLSTEEYGIVDLFTTYIALILPLVCWQLDQGIFRFMIDCREDETKTKALFSSITSVNVVQALAVVLIYLCLQPFSSSEYKIYLLIGVVLNIFSGLLMQFARGLGDMLAYSVSSFLTAASTVVLNVVFVAVLKLGAHGMFIATMCGIAINCIYLFFKLKAWKYYKPKLVDLSLIKEVCGYSLPLVPNQISGWILSASDRTIIAKFLSVAENGVYSVANKFSNLVGTFYGFFNLAWVETVSVHYNDSDRDEFIGDMMETVSNLFVSICVGIIAIMPFVFPVMVNQQYGNAYYQIPILLIAVIFQILVGLYTTFLAICLFVYTLKSNWHNKGLAVIGRKCSTWLYIIHPIFITAFSVATGKLGIKSIYRCVAPIVTYCATLTFLIVMCRLKSLLVKNNQRK